MQVSVESGEGLKRRMTVDLESEQIDAEVEKRLRELARSATMRGFRPGKVPVKVLRRRFGEQVLQEVFGDRVKESFPEAVAKEALRLAGVPEIEPDIDEGAHRYAYTAQFEVLPELELGALEGKRLKRPVAEVTDADVAAVLERLRAQKKTWKPVDRLAQRGDRLMISYTGLIDGEPFDGGSAEGMPLELGFGHMIPGFEDGLAGAQAGEQRRLELQFPDPYHVEKLKGKPVTFDVRVDEVAEPVLPELNADFAKDFGVVDGDLERFRSDVQKNMEHELRDRIDARVKNHAMELLLEANQVDLPDVLVEEEIRALKRQTLRGAGGGNFKLPNDLFREQARRRVAIGLIIGEIVRANGIELDQGRVRGVVEDMASTYENPQQFIDSYYANREHQVSVESLTLESQVVDWVMDQVAVEEEPTTFEALVGPAAGG